MKLAIFDDYRLGVVVQDDTAIVDVTAALPWPHDPDPLGAGWWVRLCRDFARLRGPIDAAARAGQPRPVRGVTLRAAVLNPSKVIAAASNYSAHREEMQAVTARVGGGRAERGGSANPSGLGWLGDFDIFLKAPSSIIGPSETFILPRQPVQQGKEIHHESELALVIGTGGKDIAEVDALDHVLGYTICLDMTVRGAGDRSRRKSYDTFTPIGPWITTADEVGDPHDLHIHLDVNGQTRQDVRSGTMDTKIPGIIAYASSIFTLNPGDVITTGAPPGVNQVHDGDEMVATISKVGTMRLPCKNQ